ncbi:MAG: heme NO-binding domain-containing protein [Magnetococcus sp. DMHC-8]
MHGIIFLALEDFLESRCGEGKWPTVMREANLAEQLFAPDCFYPDESAFDLFAAAAGILNQSLTVTLEQLGRHMSPGLVTMGRSMGLIREEWRSLDILEHLSRDILSAFASTTDGVKPPDIRTYRLTYCEVTAAYVSPRKLCPLFKGIVLGMGELFNEPIRVEERLCMLDQAPICRLSVHLDNPTLKHHVDIEREFRTVHSRIQEIRFFNQFDGIPIVHPGLVLQYGAAGVLVQIHAESLLAMREEGRTYLALPHLPRGLQAAVTSLDWGQNTVALQQIVSTEGPIGRRLFDRLVPHTPIPVSFRIGTEVLRGWMANLSEGGLCIVLKSDPLLQDTVMFTPVKMRFALPVQTVDTRTETETAPKIMLDGNILHIDEQEGRHRVRIVFKPLAVNDARQIHAYFHVRHQHAHRRLQTLIADQQK